MNVPLFSVIFSIASTVIIGVLLIIAFVNDKGTAVYVLSSAALGFLISLPVAWVVTKKVGHLTGNPDK